MNKRLIIIIVIVIIILLIFTVFKLFCKEKVSISSLKSLEYTSSDGRSISNYANYKVICDNECFLETKPYGLYDDDVIRVKVDDDTISKIISILQEYHVEEWDGFDKVDRHVLDGTTFSFYLTTKENQKISAHGYMKYPKNYSQVIEKLEDIFTKINENNYKPLYNLDYFSQFNSDDIVKVIEETTTEGGVSSEEYTIKEDILQIFSGLENILIVSECSMSCEDNNISYHFIMNDGREYRIDKECEWLVIDGKRYYYNEKN